MLIDELYLWSCQVTDDWWWKPGNPSLKSVFKKWANWHIKKLPPRESSWCKAMAKHLSTFSEVSTPLTPTQKHQETQHFDMESPRFLAKQHPPSQPLPLYKWDPHWRSYWPRHGGCVLCRGPRVFFETWRCLFHDTRNMARVELPTKNTWRSVRTLLGNSIAQIQSIWKLNYDII